MELTGYALVLIDLQRRIVALDTEPRSAAEVVANGRLLADAFRTTGQPVVLVRVENLDNPQPDGDQLVDELGVGPGDVVVTKHQWGAFNGTPLDLHLRRAGARGIVLGGLMTNFGVESTARDGDELGYPLVFAEDAMASITAAAHRFAVDTIFSRLGTVASTSDIVAALGG